MKKSFLLLSSLVAVGVLAGCIPATDPIRVGMDLRYPPFETVTGENEPEGISVDVAMAFGEYLGRPTEIVNTNFGGLIPALQSGEIDIVIASMSITAARQEVVDFTDPYFFFKIITLVNKDFAEANTLTVDSTTEALLPVLPHKCRQPFQQVMVKRSLNMSILPLPLKQ